MNKDSTNKSYGIRLSFRDIQDLIEDIRKKRDELNQKTKDYINNLQDIETEINHTLIIAKEKYKKKRDYWNKKVKKLKEKKVEYKNLLEKLITEKRNVQNFDNQGKASKKVVSINQIERKIDNLERTIEIENLDIAQENALIDEIKKLSEIKRELFNEQQSSDLFKIERKIEIVKINLNKIYEQLNKWSNKSQENHLKMQEFFQKVNELKDTKKRMEEELIENKKSADRYHEQLLELMNQKRKFLRGKKPKKPYNTSEKRYHPNKSKSDMIEKMKQDKLALALEKQKAGKKLNLYEARLILEKSNNIK